MALDPNDVPVVHIYWPSCFRIIPSRFPTVPLFDRVAESADLETVFAIEGLTNDRLRDEAGSVRIVPLEDRVGGPGAAYVMAAFTHVAPAGGRFTDGSYGAYYTAADLDTAIDETVYHRERFLRATNEGPTELEMRVLRARLRGELHDLRGLGTDYPEIFDREQYTAGQAIARQLRDSGSWGIAYDSVRHTGGECAAILRPPALSRCQQAQHLAYVWNGSNITTVYEKKILRRQP